MVQAVNNGAGSQEQQGLEKRVGHQVKDAGGERPHTQGEKHVADLTDGGVGQDTFDIVLCQGGKSRQQQRGHADPGHCLQGGRSQQEQLIITGDQVHTRGDHGGGVDQGTHWRGAGHSIGQPGV